MQLRKSVCDGFYPPPTVRFNTFEHVVLLGLKDSEGASELKSVKPVE